MYLMHFPALNNFHRRCFLTTTTYFTSVLDFQFSNLSLSIQHIHSSNESFDLAHSIDGYCLSSDTFSQPTPSGNPPAYFRTHSSHPKTLWHPVENLRSPRPRRRLTTAATRGTQRMPCRSCLITPLEDYKLTSTSKVITGSADMINIVNVKPDSHGKMFHAFIHKDLLCYYSPYYTAALKGGFSEAQNDTITIELPKKLMSELVSWLYSGTITSDEHTDLMKLYVFADEKMMLALRRSIMSRLVQAQAYWFRMEVKGAMSYLKRIPQNSGLFRYLVEFWACVWSQTDAALDLANMDDNKRIPRLFFYQALQRLAELVRNRNEKAGPITSSLVTACNFHEHISIDEWEESTSSGHTHCDLYVY